MILYKDTVHGRPTKIHKIGPTEISIDVCYTFSQIYRVCHDCRLDSVTHRFRRTIAYRVLAAFLHADSDREASIREISVRYLLIVRRQQASAHASVCPVFSMILLRRWWSRFGRHKVYVVEGGKNKGSNGSSERRPLCRGYCHFFQTLAILSWIVTRTWTEGNVSVCDGMLLFMTAKLCCVGASANLHMIAFYRERDFHVANAIDWAGIVISGWGNIASLITSPTYKDKLDPLVRSMCYYLPLVLALGVGVMTMRSGDTKRSARSRKFYDLARRVAILSGFLLSIVVDAIVLPDLSSLYICRVVLIVLGFLSWQTKARPFVRVPWHSAYFWGGHEDFHFLVFLADCALLVIYSTSGVFGGPSSSLLGCLYLL